MRRSASSASARAAGGEDRLRAALREKLDPEKLDGIVSMHLIESDPVLSKPLTDDPPVSDPGAGDWFVLIDATNVNAISEAIAARFTGSALEGGIKISAGSYQPDVGSGKIRHLIVLNQCAKLHGDGICCSATCIGAALKLGGHTNSEWRLSKNGFSVHRRSY